ncbi:MAG: M48 family metalloprotease [Phycisphaerales bacterium]|nr:M48 family metalloprotease [Phycisphaerae bacterium]NNF45080.1 M48 family metalloprotease [Phycisphaerales bacterium]NNM24369.1 M48 family metalloprotease [Phycisphaerales bacterium]
MQLYPILVVAIVLIGGSGVRLLPDVGFPRPLHAVMLAVIPAILIVATVAAVTAACRWWLARHGGPRPIVVAERVQTAGRWALLLQHAVATLLFGWMAAIQSVTGPLILLDELIGIAPPLLGVTALWWINYPLERRMREAMIIRRLDRGAPIYRIPRRGRYVLEQTRLQILLLLVPLLLIVTLSEGTQWAIERFGGDGIPAGVIDAATFGAGVIVFLLAPLIARLVLNVRSLAAGPVRDDLDEICSRHAVRVRDFLLWQTNGIMINAAVMGLIGPLRFVLLTDALVETMSREQVQAVMAHEVGHVRRHHLPWLVASLIAMLMVGGGLLATPALAAHAAPDLFSPAAWRWVDLAATGVTIILLLLLFGWISRRYERQADTFAVQHLSGLGVPRAPGTPPPVVTAEAVAAMRSALDGVARTNTVDPRRRSWRHGSIAWRQAYLSTLVGRPVDGLPIDRVIRAIKIASALVIVAGLLAAAWPGPAGDTASSRPPATSAEDPP